MPWQPCPYNVFKIYMIAFRLAYISPLIFLYNSAYLTPFFLTQIHVLPTVSPIGWTSRWISWRSGEHRSGICCRGTYIATILYYTILYYTILYYTILYYTIPHYTILYHISASIILCPPDDRTIIIPHRLYVMSPSRR